MEVKREKVQLSAELENIKFSEKSSFYVGCYRDSFFRRPWHYHPEYELILITKGFGTRMCGDNFERFYEGDLVLLGGNLPHAWISDPVFFRDEYDEVCESIYIQFRRSVFGTHFIDMPEMNSIRTILSKAGRGIKISGPKKQEITQQILSIQTLSPIEQLLTLIRVLDMIYQSEYSILASNNFAQQGLFKSAKMTQVHGFIMQNFKKEVDVNQCAKFAGMTTTSFCRFFKKHTNVTFSVYLNYMRINLAQKLLRNTQMAIKEIAFECGYTSIVYFNQKFKKMTGMSPGEFRGNKGVS